MLLHKATIFVALCNNFYSIDPNIVAMASSDFDFDKKNTNLATFWLQTEVIR